MAKELSRLFVTLGLDDKGFQKSLNNLQKSVAKWGKSMAIAGGVIVGAVGAVGTSAIKMGMDAVESENLFEVAMGNMTNAARAWSEQLSDSLGLNEYELRKNIATLFQMTSSLGLSEDAAYEMSSSLTQLAYDMASFYNLKPEEAFQKLQAGITGEAEPLKRLGILIDENTIKTVAYTAGIAEQGEQLTQQQKVQARYLAILQQTANAQGDMARTLDSPTNQLRILKSRFEEVMTTLGTSLLPVMQKVISMVAPIVEKLGNWIEKNPQLAKTILLVAGAIGGLLLALGTLGMAIGPIAAALSILLGPAGIIIAGIAVIAGLALAWKNNWGNIRGITETVVEAIVHAIGWLWDKIMWYAEFYAKAISFIMKSIANMIGIFAPNWASSVRSAADSMTQAVSDFRERSVAFLRDFDVNFQKTTEAVESNVSDMAEAVKSNVSGMAEAVEESSARQIDALNSVQLALKKNLSGYEQAFWSVVTYTGYGRSAEDLMKSQRSYWGSQEKLNEYLASQGGKWTGTGWLWPGIPGYQHGGEVPGLEGEPHLAVVHGGERVLTREQQQEVIYIEPAPVYLDGEKITEVIMRVAGRKYAQSSHFGGKA